jgi:hypothetical protein
MAFIRRLAREEERNQSTVINRIIRDFAQRRGEPLPAAGAVPPQSEPNRTAGKTGADEVTDLVLMK